MEILAKYGATVALLVVVGWVAIDHFNKVEQQIAPTPKVVAERPTQNLGTPGVNTWVGVQQSIVLQKGEEKIFRVFGDQCIRAWSANPDVEDFLVYGRGVNDKTWYTWKDFQSKKQSGEITYNPGWMKLVGNEDGGVEIGYEFRLVNQCN
jgi:hypothetical protein